MRSTSMAIARPLFPLACQLNHDQGRRQCLRLENMLKAVRTRLDRPAAPCAALAAPPILAQMPPEPAGFTDRDDDLRF
jgi:hypothetical protein